MTTIQDQRTAEERQTHVWGVAARDRFMSGWGQAHGGSSVAVWACATLGEAEAVERRIREREEMRNLRVVDLRRWRSPRGAAHVSIYVERGGR